MSTSKHFSIRQPANCSGPLRECLTRNPKLTEAKWHRGQMRGYAGYWRDCHIISALTGSSVEEVARVNLSLAKVYRDAALKLEAGQLHHVP